MDAPDVLLSLPNGERRVVLHCCCAPCSSAILEAMLNNGLEVTLFFCNPNIAPRQEYERRKGELLRHAERLGVRAVDADDNHRLWLEQTAGLHDEPERGERCALCFLIRLEATARFAADRGVAVFSSTLGSSRWKRLEQIEAAGREAARRAPGTIFWEQNWRKQGIADRRDWLVKEYDFYLQDYCGCEFSMAQSKRRRERARREAEAKKEG